jgi:hypothetical protein
MNLLQWVAIIYFVSGVVTLAGCVKLIRERGSLTLGKALKALFIVMCPVVNSLGALYALDELTKNVIIWKARK